MPRSFTPRGYRALQAEVEATPFLTLLTISFAPPTSTVYRVVNNTEPVTSRGDVFEPVAFEVAMPEDSLDRTPEIELRIDNVMLEMIDTLRAITQPPRLKIEGVMADAPDVVELVVEQFLLRNVRWDAQTVTGSLQLDDVFGLAFPSAHPIYDPLQFPGLFA